MTSDSAKDLGSIEVWINSRPRLCKKSISFLILPGFGHAALFFAVAVFVFLYNTLGRLLTPSMTYAHINFPQSLGNALALISLLSNLLSKCTFVIKKCNLPNCDIVPTGDGVRNQFWIFFLYFSLLCVDFEQMRYLCKSLLSKLVGKRPLRKIYWSVIRSLRRKTKQMQNSSLLPFAWLIEEAPAAVVEHYLLP